jgi:hypothetical protein
MSWRGTEVLQRSQKLTCRDSRASMGRAVLLGSMAGRCSTDPARSDAEETDSTERCGRECSPDRLRMPSTQSRRKSASWLRCASGHTQVSGPIPAPCLRPTSLRRPPFGHGRHAASRRVEGGNTWALSAVTPQPKCEFPRAGCGGILLPSPNRQPNDGAHAEHARRRDRIPQNLGDADDPVARARRAARDPQLATRFDSGLQARCAFARARAAPQGVRGRQSGLRDWRPEQVIETSQRAGRGALVLRDHRPSLVA